MSKKELISRMLRVNASGELAAIRIYQGQLAVLSRHKEAPLLKVNFDTDIKHMLDQELRHYHKMNLLVAENRVRPSFFTPLWNVAGFVLGASTALLGKESAMMCTEAVETVIGQHYNDQIRELEGLDSNSDDLIELKQVFKEFRDEELAHLESAVQHDAHQSPAYSALSTLIQSGCKLAIEIAKKI